MSRHKLPFAKKMVLGVGIYLVIFTQEVLLLVLLGKAEPAILIGAVFGAGLGEFGILYWIRKDDKKKGEGDGI